jgi:hypothetical protein
MAALIPILLPLKFIKVTLELFKVVKATKFRYKLGHKFNKFSSVLKGREQNSKKKTFCNRFLHTLVFNYLIIVIMEYESLD